MDNNLKPYHDTQYSLKYVYNNNGDEASINFDINYFINLENNHLDIFNVKYSFDNKEFSQQIKDIDLIDFMNDNFFRGSIGSNIMNYKPEFNHENIIENSNLLLKFDGKCLTENYNMNYSLEQHIEKDNLLNYKNINLNIINNNTNEIIFDYDSNKNDDIEIYQYALNQIFDHIITI